MEFQQGSLTAEATPPGGNESQGPRVIWGDISVSMNEQGQLVIVPAAGASVSIRVQGSYAKENTSIIADAKGVMIRLRQHVADPAAPAAVQVAGQDMSGIQQARVIGGPATPRAFTPLTKESLRAMQVVLDAFKE